MSKPKYTRLQQLAIASLAASECPPTEQLAAFALGMVSGTEQLGLAAHVRGCPLCQELITATLPPADAPSALTTLKAQPVPLAAAGLRSDSRRRDLRQYVAADILVELLIPAPSGESWTITGQVLRAGVGLSGCPVCLNIRRKPQRIAISDEAGFFTFADLPAGNYHLSATYEHVRVEIKDLELHLE